jgi:hypothetical protein
MAESMNRENDESIIFAVLNDLIKTADPRKFDNRMFFHVKDDFLSNCGTANIGDAFV